MAMVRASNREVRAAGPARVSVDGLRSRSHPLAKLVLQSARWGCAHRCSRRRHRRAPFAGAQRPGRSDLDLQFPSLGRLKAVAGADRGLDRRREGRPWPGVRRWASVAGLGNHQRGPRAWIFLQRGKIEGLPDLRKRLCNALGEGFLHRPGRCGQAADHCLKWHFRTRGRSHPKGAPHAGRRIQAGARRVQEQWQGDALSARDPLPARGRTCVLHVEPAQSCGC